MKKITERTENKFKNPFDVHRCFHIGDFRVSDNIRVMIENRTRISGVVTDVDLKEVVISYITEDGSQHKAGINDIVYLGSSNSGSLPRLKKSKQERSVYDRN
jgi:hypothetical protein